MDIVAQFAQDFHVMKPSKFNPENKNALSKWEECLASRLYVLEEKMDGCHYTLFGSRFFSIEGVEKTDNYPHLNKFFYSLKMPNLILDGEIYYEGRTSQYCTRVTGALPEAAIAFQESNGFIKYVVWDIIRLPNGQWLNNIPFENRRKILIKFMERYVKGTPMEEYISITPLWEDDKDRALHELISNGKEGGVLKRRDSLYVFGKAPAWQWIKYKQKEEADVIITGFEPPKKIYTGSNYESWEYWEVDPLTGTKEPVTKYWHMGWIGSIIISAYVNGELTVIGKSSGISEDIRKDMSENKENYIGKVIRIEFMEKTESGYPRHPRFKNIHEGKRKEQCTWELY